MITKYFLHTLSNGVWNCTTSSGKTGLPLQALWALRVVFFILIPGSPAEIKQQSEKELCFKLSATDRHLNQTSDMTSKSPGYLKASSLVAQNAAILYLLFI